MQNDRFFLSSITDVSRIITPLDKSVRFPEIIEQLIEKYARPIEIFCSIIQTSNSSEDVLHAIRDCDRDAEERMALLKMYRRCVSPVLDTETTKKIRKVSTNTLIETYGSTFKPISKLKNQFINLPKEYKYALAALIGEYDTRGQLGYELTNSFFNWFEHKFSQTHEIFGPRGAGKDIELSSIFPDFKGSMPCDFIIRRIIDAEILAIGFARYDSTRGGAQSDDRTGGNACKVQKVKEFDAFTKSKLKMIYVADGPGLMHKDTWEEACSLDGQWDGRVRVTTLKLADYRITLDWLES